MAEVYAALTYYYEHVDQMTEIERERQKHLSRLKRQQPDPNELRA